MKKSIIIDGVQKRTHAPCKDCKRRAVGCHSVCVDYLDYKKQLSIAQADALAKNASDEISANYLKTRRDKIQKRRRKKK